MKTIYHFLRLIRLTNLLVIGLTMIVVEVFFLKYKIFHENVVLSNDFISSQVPFFFLFVLSTLLIAAAGNIINDYFDVKADRINKPNRLIIGKHIKRRWAMVLHWSFNSIGMMIALYVGYKLQNIWMPLIAFLSINLLWFYSAYYKRKPLVGNLIVALLIGIIPIYVLLFNFPFEKIDNRSIQYFYSIIFFVSTLAILLNLIRELVKDIQDVRGDLKLGAKTFPIKYGIKKTKYLISFFMLLLIAVTLYYVFFILSQMSIALPLPPLEGELYTEFNPKIKYFLGCITLSGLILTISWIILIVSNKTRIYKIASTLLKIAMLFGLLTPLFL